MGSDTVRRAGRDAIGVLGRLHDAVSASAAVPAADGPAADGPAADGPADRIAQASQGCERFRQQIRPDLKLD